METFRFLLSPYSKKMKKKTLIIVLIVLTVLGAVSFILLEYGDTFLTKKETTVTSMYSDRIVSYNFYPTDYDLDVTKDDWYMGLDRYIHIQRGAENFAITDGDYASWGEDIAFFAKYFETAIAGDAETYNTFFTENYYKSAEPYDQFAPQMIYGIELELLEETDAHTVYNVTYAIYRNDGTFRNDIDSDAFKTLIFELVTENGEWKINAIDWYRVAGNGG